MEGGRGGGRRVGAKRKVAEMVREVRGRGREVGR